MTPPMRVLHVLPDLGTGGGQMLVLELAKALRPHAEVEVAFLGGPEDLRQDFERCGVPVHRLLASGCWPRARATLTLVRLTRNRAIDVLHAHSSPDKHITQAAGLITRRPVIAHLHVWRDHAHRDQGMTRRVRSWARRLAGLLTVRCYIAISESVMAANVSTIARANHRLVLVRNGISLAPYQSSARSSRGSMTNDGPVLLWVGRFSSEKDVPLLVKMMSFLRDSHPSARLLLAGEGPQRSRIQEEVAYLGLEATVIFLGRRTDIPTIMATADVFVFSSISEGFGLAVAEAQAAGLPVVACRIPALEEIVEDDVTGVLVSSRNPYEMAESVRCLLEDNARRLAMGRAARRRAHELFDITCTAAQLLAVYRRFVGRANV